MEFSFLSAVNKITELLWLLFSDFFLNCFLPAPSMQDPKPKKSFHMLLFHIISLVEMADSLPTLHAGSHVTGQPVCSVMTHYDQYHLLHLSFSWTHELQLFFKII